MRLFARPADQQDIRKRCSRAHGPCLARKTAFSEQSNPIVQRTEEEFGRLAVVSEHDGEVDALADREAKSLLLVRHPNQQHSLRSERGVHSFEDGNLRFVGDVVQHIQNHSRVGIAQTDGSDVTGFELCMVAPGAAGCRDLLRQQVNPTNRG